MKVSLFVTCIIDQFYPKVGESTVRILERLGCDVDFPRDQTCCGQPAFNSGYWSDARSVAKNFLNVFEECEKIVVPSGSCANMIRNSYSQLFENDPDSKALAQSVGSRVFELSEFISKELKVTDLKPMVRKNLDGPPQKVAYHEACHLKRELGVSQEPKNFLGQLPNVELVDLEQSDVCCGFGGSFSVKYPDISGAMLNDKISFLEKSGAQTVVACDASCLMHIGGGLQKQGCPIKAKHFAEILDEGLAPR